MRGTLVLNGLELRFRAGAGDLLAVQFVVQFAALLLQPRALGLLPHQFVAGGDHFSVQFAQRFAQFLDLAAAGEQVRHPRLHASAGHRAAGMHDVALECHQTEGVASGALYADTGFEVFRHHRAPKEIVDDAALLFVKADQFRGHAQAAGQLQHLALARVEHAGRTEPMGRKVARPKRLLRRYSIMRLASSSRSTTMFCKAPPSTMSMARSSFSGTSISFRHHAVHA